MKGRPEDVTIDDLFPVMSHEPAFAKPSVDGGWWLPLLEKVFAKVNVNYEMLTSGSQVEAARFLTGSPAKEFKSGVEDLDEIWLRITSAIKRDDMITAACFLDTHGLVAGNGYIVKDFLKVQYGDGSDLKLVKMKNPWKVIGDPSFTASSHGDWVGKFSKSDTKSWTPDLKLRAKLDKLQKGEFFMTIEDFK